MSVLAVIHVIFTKNKYNRIIFKGNCISLIYKKQWMRKYFTDTHFIKIIFVDDQRLHGFRIEVNKH